MIIRAQARVRPAPARQTRVPASLAMPMFLLLTLILSWGALLPTDGQLLPHGPFLGAIVVLGLCSGRQGVADLFHRMAAWRVGLRWYVVAPGLVIAPHAVALAVAGGAGDFELAPVDHSWALSLTVIPAFIVAGGQWEEPGWLAFLLARLQRHRSWAPWLVLALATAVRITWHLPLFAYGTIPWYDFLFGIAALQVLLMWLYNATGGSLVLPMLCHLTSNVALALVRGSIDTADHNAYWAVYTAAVSVVAISVLVGTRGRLGWTAGSKHDG